MGEKIRDAAGIIKILQLDFQRELEATMVYVRNAFVIKQCDPSGTTFLTATDLFANDELQMERVERY